MEDGALWSELSKCKILIVDDVAVLRTLIQTCLQKAGFKNLHIAENGDQALEILSEVSPDLIILDIVMPGTDGFEVCRRIRKSKEFSWLPILIQTGMEATQERAEVFEVGANDLISKPINVYELIARVKLQLQNLILKRKEQASQERLEAEIKSARIIQKSLLPTDATVKAIEDNYGVEINHMWEASSELGGDLWGVSAIDEHRFGVFIIDFSGHGVVSALNTFRLHTLINESEIDWTDPSRCLKAVNAHLVKVLAPEQFATLFWAMVDLRSNKVTYSAAAAPPVLVGNKTDHVSIDYVDTSGLPVGVLSSVDYENKTVDFSSESVLFLYSDALIESECENGEMWLEEGLLKRAQSNAQKGFETLYDNIRDDFFKSVKQPIADDLTMVCISRKD